MIRRSPHSIVLALSVLALMSLDVATALEDPTRPASPVRHVPTHASQPGQGGWLLNSTLVGPNRRIAVINGAQVSEGESVSGARVVQIHKSYVLLETAGRSIKLQLLPGSIRK